MNDVNKLIFDRLPNIIQVLCHILWKIKNAEQELNVPVSNRGT